MAIKMAIFDLDGVLTDTAKYHYVAWKTQARKLGFDFTKEDNERLKGVSRARSLEILLEIGGLLGKFSQEEFERIMEDKNNEYLGYIGGLTGGDLLPGALDTLKNLKAAGVLVGLGSASKSGRHIIDKLGITSYFDAISDGTRADKPKPDPQVFMLCADDFSLPYCECAVFEDSQAGIDAAKSAGMFAVAVGSRENLKSADIWVDGLDSFAVDMLS